MRHCWPTTPKIVECYLLRPFAHPVACCCAKFETGQTLSYVQRDATELQFAVCSLPFLSGVLLCVFFYVVSKVSPAQKLNRCRNRKPLRRRRGEVKVIWTTSFPRPLRNRFFFVLGFSFCAAESLTLRTTSEKNTPRNASYAG